MRAFARKSCLFFFFSCLIESRGWKEKLAFFVHYVVIFPCVSLSISARNIAGKTDASIAKKNQSEITKRADKMASMNVDKKGGTDFRKGHIAHKTLSTPFYRSISGKIWQRWWHKGAFFWLQTSTSTEQRTCTVIWCLHWIMLSNRVESCVYLRGEMGNEMRLTRISLAKTNAKQQI